VVSSIAVLAIATLRTRSIPSGTTGSAARRSRADAKRHRAGDQAEDLARAPRVALAAPDAGQHQRGGGGGDQPRAGGIDWRPIRRSGRRRQTAAERDQGERPDREVDVEHPAPAGVLHEQPSDQRTHDGGDGERGGDVALIAAALARCDQVSHCSHGQGHQPAGRRALHRAQRDQHPDGLRNAAQRGGADEHHKRDFEQQLAAMAVTELAPQRRTRGRGDDIGGDDPRHVAQPPQLRGDGGQRGGEDGLVEHGRQHRHHDRGEGQPQSAASRRPVLLASLGCG
jgi:hypothetical protein